MKKEINWLKKELDFLFWFFNFYVGVKSFFNFSCINLLLLFFFVEKNLFESFNIFMCKVMLILCY